MTDQSEPESPPLHDTRRSWTWATLGALAVLATAVALTDGRVRTGFGLVLIIWPLVVAAARRIWGDHRPGEIGLIVLSMPAAAVVTGLVLSAVNVSLNGPVVPFVLALAYVGAVAVAIAVGADGNQGSESGGGSKGRRSGSTVIPASIIATALVVVGAAVVVSITTAREQDELGVFVALTAANPTSSTGRAYAIDNEGTEAVTLEVSEDSAAESRQYTVTLRPGERVEREPVAESGAVRVTAVADTGTSRVVRRIELD